MNSLRPGWIIGFPEGAPLAGVVRADAMVAKPEINAAVVKCMVVKQDWATAIV